LRAAVCVEGITILSALKQKNSLKFGNSFRLWFVCSKSSVPHSWSGEDVERTREKCQV